MIDLDKLSKEQLKTLVEWGLMDEIYDAVRRETDSDCKEQNYYFCSRSRGHKGCHIAALHDDFRIWNPAPAPVGVPAGLAVSIAQALLTAAQAMPEDGEIVCIDFCNFAGHLLQYHPESAVGSYHWREIGSIQDGDYDSL